MKIQPIRAGRRKIPADINDDVNHSLAEDVKLPIRSQTDSEVVGQNLLLLVKRAEKLKLPDIERADWPMC